MPTLSPEQIERLAEKMLLGTITPDEQALLNEWACLAPGDQLYWASGDADEAELKGRLLARIRETTGMERAHGEQEEMEKPVRRIPLVRRMQPVHRARWVAAAIIGVLLMGGGYLFMSHSAGTPPPAGRTVAKFVGAPGGDRAILTLADGSDILLDSAANGQLAQQGGIKVIKLADGQLKYEGQAGKEAANNGAAGYNTVHTPRGGQYRLILPDGTKVWLNAASSITYPTVFAASERVVKITGEVYFEVAPDKAKAFRADVNDTRIEVLGTHFNINAYSDESSLKTTLLEGSVRVSHGAASRVLLPGQQAVVNDGLQIDKKIDIDQVMAWKNGLFIFNNKKFDEIMRQLSRWYDIDIVYDKGVPDIELAGEMGRDLNLLQVLDGLKDMNVRYRLEGKKLIVLR